MKKSVLILLAVLLVVLIVGMSVFAAENETLNATIGKLFHGAAEEQAEAEIAATYGEISIEASTVAYYRQIEESNQSNGTVRSEKEIIRDIVSNIVLKEEAERHGLKASEEEIAEQLEIQKNMYAESEFAKKVVDDFCEGAGLSLDAYYEMIEEQLSDTITRSNLYVYYAKIWCEEHGLKYEGHKHDERLQSYVNAQIDELLQKEWKRITYCD